MNDLQGTRVSDTWVGGIFVLGGPLLLLGGVTRRLPRVRDRAGGCDVVVRWHGGCSADRYLPRHGGDMDAMHCPPRGHGVLVVPKIVHQMVLVAVMLVRVIGADVGSERETGSGRRDVRQS